MTAKPIGLTWKHEWTLDLPGRNLCVRLERSSTGNYHAVLVDLGEFRGEGSVQGLAIDDLANDLEHVAAEIRALLSLSKKGR